FSGSIPMPLPVIASAFRLSRRDNGTGRKARNTRDPFQSFDSVKTFPRPIASRFLLGGGELKTHRCHIQAGPKPVIVIGKKLSALAGVARLEQGEFTNISIPNMAQSNDVFKMRRLFFKRGGGW